MTTIRNLAIMLVLLAAVSLVVLPVAARNWDDNVEKPKYEDNRIIVEEDGETYICHVKHGERLHVIRERDGKQIVDLDMAELHESLAEAMEGVHEALSELEKIDIDIDWDDDGILELDIDEAHLRIDLDDILDEAMDAIALIGDIHLDDLDFDDVHVHWDDDGDRHHRVIIDDDDEISGELKDELEDLREELKQLKKELKKAKRDRD